MRIENYLGFPTGVIGSELAERAVVQASKFGTRLPVPTPVAECKRLKAERARTLHIEVPAKADPAKEVPTLKLD
jgi:thioredoxin reductase